MPKPLRRPNKRWGKSCRRLRSWPNPTSFEPARWRPQPRLGPSFCRCKPLKARRSRRPWRRILRSKRILRRQGRPQPFWRIRQQVFGKCCFYSLRQRRLTPRPKPKSMRTFSSFLHCAALNAFVNFYDLVVGIGKFILFQKNGVLGFDSSHRLVAKRLFSVGFFGVFA